MSVEPNVSWRTILEPEKREELGEPVEWEVSSSAKPILNVEYSEFKDPDVRSYAARARNVASELNMSLELDDTVNEAREKAARNLEEFTDRFTDNSSENPVFVSSDVLENLGGSDRAVGYMNFLGDPALYPVTLKPFGEFEEVFEEFSVAREEDLEENRTGTEDAKREYLDEIRDMAFSNQFVVPSYWNSAGTPSEIPATLLKGPQDDIVWDEASGAEWNSDQVHYGDGITEIEADEGYIVQMDVSQVNPDRMNTEIEDGELKVYADGSKIYSSAYMEDGFGEILEEEFNEASGFYSVKID